MRKRHMVSLDRNSACKKHYRTVKSRTTTLHLGLSGSALLAFFFPLSICAATFPTPGQDKIYDNPLDTAIDGQQGASELLLTGGQRTTMTVDNIDLNILNFTNSFSAIQLDGADFTIDGVGDWSVFFKNNHPSTSFGGVINSNASTITLTNATFINNNSNYGGGAIYNASGVLNLNVDSGRTTLFNGNVDPSGKNSITFDGNSSNLNLNPSQNGLIDMRDPMRIAGFTPTNVILTISKNGAGTWALGGTNNFTDGTTTINIQAGTFYLYKENSALDVANGSISLSSAQSSFTFNTNVALVAGGTNIITAGNATVNFENGSTVRGGNANTSLGGGTGRFEQGGDTSLTITANNGAKLNGVITISAVAEADTFTFNATLKDGDSVGSIVKEGDGKVVLTQSSTYTGGTTINAGTLTISDDSNLGDSNGSITFNKGKLQNTSAMTAYRNIHFNDDGTFITDADLTLEGNSITGGGEAN